MKIISVIALICFTTMAQAQLSLVPEQSSLFFISIKSNSVGETFTFDKLSGSVDKKGTAVLEIDLASVNSSIEIRDQRMREHLFNIAEFPSARITAQVDLQAIDKLKSGEELIAELKGAVDLHGQKANVFTNVLISKNASGTVRVTTLAPILVNARHFSMVSGIGILRKQAGLTVISSVVPVSFSLVFK